jgi:uncharacterized SAM-binding protein YcdF (DUF218 family)
MLWTGAALILIGIVLALLPFHITMTGICLAGLGTVLILLYILKKKKCPKVWRVLLIALTGVCAAAVLTGMIAVDAQGRSDNLAGGGPEFVVVLGAQTHKDQPSRTLRERLELAAEYLKANPDAVAFVSGGQGSDETQTESSVMKAYLLKKDIGEDQVIEENQASTTRENLINSQKLASAMGLDTSSVLIITSDFHLCRAKYIASTLGMRPYGLASRTTPWILKVNYELREVFAFVKARMLAGD